VLHAEDVRGESVRQEDPRRLRRDLRLHLRERRALLGEDGRQGRHVLPEEGVRLGLRNGLGWLRWNAGLRLRYRAAVQSAGYVEAGHVLRAADVRRQ
jgi:hypothetical protein